MSHNINNSNSMIAAGGVNTTARGLINLSQTTNELSAILPPKYQMPGKQFQALRGGSKPLSMQIYNESFDDPSRHILSREVGATADGNIFCDENLNSVDEAKLESSFAQRQQATFNQ